MGRDIQNWGDLWCRTATRDTFGLPHSIWNFDGSRNFEWTGSRKCLDVRPPTMDAKWAKSSTKFWLKQGKFLLSDARPCYCVLGVKRVAAMLVMHRFRKRLCLQGMIPTQSWRWLNERSSIYLNYEAKFRWCAWDHFVHFDKSVHRRCLTFSNLWELPKTILTDSGSN